MWDKQTVLQLAAGTIQERIAALQRELDDLREDLSADTKSTAGDKHETSRAMAQIEQEKLGNQINQLTDHLMTLRQIKAGEKHTQAGFGSLVHTDKGIYFLSSAIGALKAETPVFCISMHTPMAQALTGKNVGMSVTVNGNAIRILHVE